ncbi:MAG: YggS family pyridoxal phosphate-dependent enzyme [Phycisphaerales bacterium]
MPTDPNETTLAQRYQAVRDRIANAAARAERDPASVMLVAVTKFADPSDIRELIALGHRDFGENRVQNMLQRVAMADEFIERTRTLAAVDGLSSVKLPSDSVVRWHMIGTLQRNKVKKVVDCARLIHSVDNLRLAEEIHTLAVRRDRPVEVLMQVNCSGEAQKGGVAPAAAIALAEQMETMINVRLRGLMTMAAYSDNPEDSRSTFRRLRELFEEMEKCGFADGRFNILSMGMSNDFEVAIEEGANLVRVGSAIFGEREIAEDPETDEDDEATGEVSVPARERAAR